MIIKSSISAADRRSIEDLLIRVDYIVDAKAPSHKNKTVLQAKNHNCHGNDAEDFILSCDNNNNRYIQVREGKRGKRSSQRWREEIYSSPKGTIGMPDGNLAPALNLQERAKVEASLLDGPFKNASTRYAWHICKITGRCDCHFLISEHDIYGIVWMYNGFGKGKKNIKLEFERIEETLIKALNRSRPPDQQLKTPRQRNREKLKQSGSKTFAEKLVEAGWDGRSETLRNAAINCGYRVIRQHDKRITVVSLMSGVKEKEISYGIFTLIQNWSKAKWKLLENDSQDFMGLE